MHPQYAFMLISRVHFQFFLSPKDAKLKVDYKKIYLQSLLRSREFAKKTPKCWVPTLGTQVLSTVHEELKKTYMAESVSQ